MSSPNYYLIELTEQWSKHKCAEKDAQEKRRELEDEIKFCLQMPEDLEGVKNVGVPGLGTLKITGRVTEKVDAERVRNISLITGFMEEAQDLFRWEARINKRAWNAADKNITDKFLPAITTKPGRASFQLKIEEEKE